jgi:hypothetical protein
MDWFQIITAFIVFSSVILIVLILGLILYFEKRLKHKQILAAIEKGIPLSELRLVKPQVKYTSIGIALLIIALALLVVGDRGPLEFLCAILLGTGVAWIVRGLLHRKYYLKEQALSQSNNRADMDVPASEGSQKG